jgi:HPr kinase/phosphorylase
VTPISPYSLQALVDQLGSQLQLQWLTPPPVHPWPLRDESATNHPRQNLVGALNCIHPNRLQVLGQAEMQHLRGLSPPSREDMIARLFEANPAAVIFAEEAKPDDCCVRWAEQCGTPLLASPLPDQEILDRLQYFLTHALAERIIIHGVFLEVLGMGVLLIGDAGVGKSELALELIARGHRLIADDAPEFARTAPETLEGRCPPLLRDFLEVRGLGILNIRAMFGEGAVRETNELHLVINMCPLERIQLATIDRLRGSLSARSILGVAVPEITIPVAPGRNLAVLVESAVRNQILRQRGYDAGTDLMDRQTQALADTHALATLNLQTARSFVDVEHAL